MVVISRKVVNNFDFMLTTDLVSWVSGHWCWGGRNRWLYIWHDSCLATHLYSWYRGTTSLLLWQEGSSSLYIEQRRNIISLNFDKMQYSRSLLMLRENNVGTRYKTLPHNGKIHTFTLTDTNIKRGKNYQKLYLNNLSWIKSPTTILQLAILTLYKDDNRLDSLVVIRSKGHCDNQGPIYKMKQLQCKLHPHTWQVFQMAKQHEVWLHILTTH